MKSLAVCTSHTRRAHGRKRGWTDRLKADGTLWSDQWQKIRQSSWVHKYSSANANTDASGSQSSSASSLHSELRQAGRYDGSHGGWWNHSTSRHLAKGNSEAFNIFSLILRKLAPDHLKTRMCWGKSHMNQHECSIPPPPFPYEPAVKHVLRPKRPFASHCLWHVSNYTHNCSAANRSSLQEKWSTSQLTASDLVRPHNGCLRRKRGNLGPKVETCLLSQGLGVILNLFPSFLKWEFQQREQYRQFYLFALLWDLSKIMSVTILHKLRSTPANGGSTIWNYL